MLCKFCNKELICLRSNVEDFWTHKETGVVYCFESPWQTGYWDAYTATPYGVAQKKHRLKIIKDPERSFKLVFKCVYCGRELYLLTEVIFANRYGDPTTQMPLALLECRIDTERDTNGIKAPPGKSA